MPGVERGNRTPDGRIHVFDMKATPPNELQPVAASHVPHWLTFSIDGRFAYVAGRKGSADLTDVIDVPTYQRVSSLEPSEDLLEVASPEEHSWPSGTSSGSGAKRARRPNRIAPIQCDPTCHFAGHSSRVTRIARFRTPQSTL